MNKLFFSLLILFVLIPTVLATDIAYVVKNPETPNNNLISAINELGYTYSLVDDSELPYIDFSDYGMILLGDENIRNVPVNTYKSLIVNQDYYTSWSDNVGVTNTNNAFNLEHMITEGLEGEFQPYTENNLPLYYLSGRKYSTSSITVKDDSSSGRGKFVIATKQLPRRVFFGITESNYWTQESRQLFKNSISWVLYGEDGDEDGYHYDVDCNDADPEVWQNLPGYLDADSDNYGTGSLLQVCSGNELREGYSEINGDCNDNNANANPEGIEIPYNTIDEDCSGSDLNDVDEDGIDYPQDCNDDNELIWQLLSGYTDSDNDSYGYGSLLDICSGEDLEDGYSKTNGDCDDNDETINPGSTDVYKNCKNDAPIVQAIPKITVSEGETAIIEIIAEDPEDDELDYSINDARFTQTNNVFEWQTDYSDYGNYDFTITVSDGSLETEIEIEVKVNNINQAPICNEIPEQEWQEDTTHNLDLSLYCSDPDGQIIKYYFQETSEDLHIKLDSINKDTGLAEFSVEENWNGEDWIIFKVSDGLATTYTNTIVLRVNGINDAPEFNGYINNIQWNEDTTCTNCLDLTDYFSDADIAYGDELTYEVTPNLNIDIQIDENGLVTFVPLPNYYTTLPDTVVFSATDSELQTIYSHEVYLVVVDTNEPPEFQSMDCETDILEDTEYNCQLEATDFENNPLTFTISSQNNLVCEIKNNELVYYTSSLNYNGLASCTIKAQDNNGGEDTYNLEVNALPVNDAPTITSYNPTSNPRLLEGQSQSFSIATTDIDGDILIITWKLNDIEVGTGNNYLFNQPVGSHALKVVVTDSNGGEYSHEWNVFVGDIGDFTCAEVGGFVLAEKQICPVNGELLETLDSNVIKCCSIAGEPAFSEIKRCTKDNITDKINIDIKKPDENNEFKIQDKINAKINVENNFEEDLDFDVEISFYDISEDEEIENYEDSLDIDKGKDEDIETEFLVDEDIDEKNDYAVFVKVIDENENSCNEKYVPISIEREDNDVRIQDFTLEPETAICGDYVFASAKIKNLGADNQDAYIVIENSELEISQKSGEFELEEYGEKDEASQSLQFQIPENAEAGRYEIKASVFYDDGDEKSSVSKTLVLEECKRLEQNQEEIKTISLQGEQKEVNIKTQDSKERNKKIIIFFFSTLVSMAVVIYLLHLIAKYYY